MQDLCTTAVFSSRYSFHSDERGQAQKYVKKKKNLKHKKIFQNNIFLEIFTF